MFSKMYDLHSIPYERNSRENRDRTNTKHAKCTCCPYGYHIDLDFVRYCESLELDGSVSEQDSAAFRRRERRRQRQSMEVLLGLIATPANTPQSSNDAQRTNEWIIPEKNQQQSYMVDEALQDVVSDFERTLASHNNLEGSKFKHIFADGRPNYKDHRMKSTNNGPNLYKSNFNYPKSSSIRHEQQQNSESTSALHTIREQMALSLERMRNLEEQVQTIPILQVQISVLKEKNRNLIAQLLKYEKADSSIMVQSLHNKTLHNNSLSRIRSSSFSDVSIKNLTPKRDVGITCTVITRDIGVGSAIQQHHQKAFDSSTQTVPKALTISKTSQTTSILPVARHTIGIQAINDTSQLHIAEKRDIGVQSVSSKTVHVGVNVKPQQSSVHTSPKPTPTVHDVGVGTSSVSLSTVLNSSMTRSKSFNMGENQLNLSKRMRSTGTQYTIDNRINRSTQTQVQLVPNKTEASQYEVPSGTFINRSCQSAHVQTEAKSCDTIDLRTTVDVGIVTNLETTVPTLTTSNLKRSDSSSSTSSPTVSRIPRPQTLVSTPPEQRRLQRQITYTKIPAVEVVNSEPNVPKHDISEKIVENSNETHEENYVNNTTQILTTSYYDSMDLPENSYLLTDSSEMKTRQKVQPSKEMRAAMKVVNDFLLKNSNKNVNHLKSARNIIQQEWFKISSTVHANPLDIEDYMDCIEEVSNELLHYVVNMIDNSGNTAMHYAVSHGNFDVVSILLDSKVCMINCPNSAGYTAIMLLSLAEVRSPTHSNVIRKLFQLADVNIKAKQHGQTALMLAVSHGRLDMATLLLEAGADVNIQDEDGSTALMCAAEHGHIDIVRLFLAQPDCDSSIQDVDGSTALKIALEAGHRDIGVLLYAHERMTSGASPYASLHRQRKTAARSKPPSPKLPRSPIATTPSTPKH